MLSQILSFSWQLPKWCFPLTPLLYYLKVFFLLLFSLHCIVVATEKADNEFSPSKKHLSDCRLQARSTKELFKSQSYKNSFVLKKKSLSFFGDNTDLVPQIYRHLSVLYENKVIY
jgi:hypothetical protein